ncbi:MAG: GNAT family N-acetyltransferase [Oscillospiraceae bacterium]|nr:GNAT family N-acetyltransferase [Oscillospiraceae bacterium]
MRLYLAKPDLYFFGQYNEMMTEWQTSGTQIAPWFLDKPFESLEDFAKFVQMLDNCENANLDKRFSSTTSYFVTDENGRLVGAASLRHYLTVDGYNTWGHIGYGVRPSERLKGYATCILKMTLAEAKNKKLQRVLLGCHSSNVGSAKVIEKCGGILENIVADPDDKNETIRRYWIDNK